MAKRLYVLFLFFFSLLTADVPTLESITRSSPTEWVQRGDRWNFKGRFEDQREELYPVLEKMGIFDAHWAQKSHYDYAIVLGALKSAVESRMQHLISEWERGVRFDKVVFLTGQRPLHPTKEESLVHLKNETAMMLHVWNALEMPEEMREVPLTVIDAPPLPLRGRPTTESTVYAWLEMEPEPGVALMVSNQPYVGYQQAVLQVLLPHFMIEGVGAEGGRTLPLSILMDTIGKECTWKARLPQGVSLNPS